MEIILHPVLEKKNLYNLSLIKEITIYYCAVSTAVLAAWFKFSQTKEVLPIVHTM